MSQAVKQVKLVSQEALAGQDFELTSLYDQDGNPVDLSNLVARVEFLEDEVGKALGQ